jgi:hypothetical protein
MDIKKLNGTYKKFHNTLKPNIGMLSCRGKTYQNMNVHTLMGHKHKELELFKTSYQEARKNTHLKHFQCCNL